jgi:hypothetical protein
MDPQIIETKLQEFVEWINEQPELPKNFDRLSLVRYLKASEFDLEVAKEIFVKSLQIRRDHPEIFTQRDVQSDGLQELIKIM